MIDRVLELVAIAGIAFLIWRKPVAQADIDALTAKVNTILATVTSYTPPVATDGTEDLTALSAAVDSLQSAVSAKLTTPATPVVEQPITE